MARRKGEPRLPLPCGYEQLNSHTRIIVDEALRRHITVEIVDPVLGELCLRLGDRTVTTLESLSELTHAVAFRRCDDKLLTRRVLGQANLPIVPGQAATFDDTDQRFLEQYRDLVVKPVRGEQGRGISVGVTTSHELRRGCEYARQYWPEVLLEQRWVGEDLRVVVINAEMVAAAIRRPPTVTGTGSETLYQLIDQHRRQRVLDMGTGSTVPVNEAARATLRAAGFDDLEVVLPEGVTVTFLRTANVHTGGTIEDVTEGLHPALEGLAVAGSGSGRPTGSRHRPHHRRRRRPGRRDHRGQRATGSGQPRTETNRRPFRGSAVPRDPRSRGRYLRGRRPADAGTTLMCGLAGELRTDTRPADVEATLRMAEALAPRGPDGAGAWSANSVVLAHRRLSVIDLSWRGDQPMVDTELGLVVVFNGCIYNHRLLRQELEAVGYRFFSASDTEVLLKAYHHWGDHFVDHLVGMFALCIVERDSGRAVLARDRLGIKPLYLSEVTGGIRFASTLPALVAGGLADTSIDPIALHHYLTFHAVVPEERTLLTGVRRLAPATVLTIERDGRRHERRYWDLTCEPDPARAGWDAGDWEEAVMAALQLAVRRRLEADVPVGVLLSGGLDSSLIVALLSEAGQQGLATFSIGFEAVGEEEGDEFLWSDLISDRFGTDHHRILVPTGEVLDALPGVVAAMSEPMVSHDVVAFYLLSREVARSIKVVQSGQGADEVFAGYHWYQPMFEDQSVGVERYQSVFCDRTHADMAAVVNPEYQLDSDVSRQFLTSSFARPGAPTALDRALRIDTQVMLVEDPVKRVDNMTMAWGLEGRVPFLDHELVELAGACPGALKVAQGGKGVLKQLARRVLPSEVIDRPKGYFPVPPLVKLQGPCVQLMGDALTSTAARDRALFDKGHVQHLLTHPEELTTLRYNKLWQLGLLELWLQTHGL